MVGWPRALPHPAICGLEQLSLLTDVLRYFEQIGVLQPSFS